MTNYEVMIEAGLGWGETKDLVDPAQGDAKGGEA
jgi:hypothetical protein